MNTKIDFSAKRMLQVAKHDFANEYRSYLLIFITMFVTLLASLLFFIWTGRYDGFPVIAKRFCISAWIIIGWGSCLYTLTTMMRPMRTKEERIAYLMLPATAAEKFVFRLLLVTVGYWLASFVTLLAVDVCYQLFVVASGWDASMQGSLTMLLFHGSASLIVAGDSSSVMSFDISMLWGVSSSLCSIAFWIFGSCLWYRHTVRNTLATQVALTFILLIVLSSLVVSFGERLGIFFMENGNAIFAIWSAVNIIATLLLLWGAYRLFAKAQIVSRYKFILR